ncbi:PepSY-associated TM helix domain-containing protein [Methylobacterium sp. J-077]|uniref:PepSY-associated TM helix domain-containing protein n=1 Tax=Methylobacterium sp. J-077 TaxID=2836656 RepID=UPI001FBA57C3|nr:PepSY-associated TM helix domain-containing protein [Methylobacterium sp. J-077]MCJ2126276.1 PepSY domain-containing protein [Methylobacterium sp. J-077]
MSRPKKSLRQSMAWLHTWSGLVVGWVLFAIFVTGTASYYRTEISHWMRPELSETPADPAAAANRAAAYLARQMPDAIGWSIRPPTAENPAVEVYWWNNPDGPYHHALLDPATGEASRARDTKGGDFLYRFHFELALPPVWGRWIVGTCAMILLISLISGIVTHRRIFADFFTFRRDKSAQRGWLDAHNVVGVLALPFHLMIVYTGLIELGPMLMPWGVQAAYRHDILAYYAESGIMAATRTPAGRPGTLIPLGEIVARAIDAHGESPEVVLVTMPGDAASSVTAFFEEPPGLAHLHPQIVYAGDTGAELSRTGDVGAATRTGAVMIGLHEAHFAAAPLRVLLFLCGVMGAATIASGLVLWTVARAPKGADPAGFGLRLVRVLNLGTIAGLPTGLAAYFLANRLLSLDLAGRASWEVRGFFAAWILAALAAILYPKAKAWPAALGVSALAFLAIPVVDAFTIGEARFLGFDAAMLVVAILLALGARLAARAPSRLRAARPNLSRTVEA